MYIKEIYHEKRPVFSLEVFPPRPDYPLDTIYSTLDQLRTLKPDFISVTYGAGGSSRGRTVEIAKYIHEDCQIETMAHLTCVGHTHEEILQLVQRLKSMGVDNILALRGDLPQALSQGESVRGDFPHACDLIAFIKAHSQFSLGAAAYPEGHPESIHMEADLLRLKEKVDTGVDFLITQLFLDNRYFFEFLNKARKIGINVPVSAGIMPVLNSNIERIISLSHAKVPPELQRILDKYGRDPEAMERAGIDYAVSQIDQLLANGVDGVHLYTMNKPDQTRLILQQVRPITL